MLYLPTATLTTPVVVQQTPTIPLLTATTPYYMVPTVPFLNTALVYPPTYAFQTKLIEKSPPTQVKESVQHVIHHYPSSYRVNHCCDCCELCCCMKNYETTSERRSRSRTPPRESPVVKHDKSTETIDYYRRPITPPIRTPPRVPYKIHYDAPKPRPRSSSSHRSPSLPREPWRPTNQNDYPWRDAHLPAYRDATLNRPKTPDNQYQTKSSPCHDNNYIYRPKSETQARKYYIETTGKNPDVEVYNSLRPNTSAYDYKNSCYNTQENRQTIHSFYSDVSLNSAPKVVDLTHSLKRDDACIHIVPKNGSKLDPPYLKIYNSPVTYLH